MSPRALQRRLDSDGTSSREEVRMLRYERATRLLREGMPRAAIAAQLGYSDTRAAVRRAHPAPPASFRSPAYGLNCAARRCASASSIT